MTAEHECLHAASQQAIPWKQWGPYLGERELDTVREAYSESDKERLFGLAIREGNHAEDVKEYYYYTGIFGRLLRA
jgi:hypothetical protein